MIVFDGVSFTFRNGSGKSVIVFRNFNLRIDRGQYLALIGPNGSGKTTLALMAKGIVSPSGGKILCMGEDLTGRGINLRIGYIFSNPENQIVSAIVEAKVSKRWESFNCGDPSPIDCQAASCRRFWFLESWR